MASVPTQALLDATTIPAEVHANGFIRENLAVNNSSATNEPGNTKTRDTSHFDNKTSHSTLEPGVPLSNIASPSTLPPAQITEVHDPAHEEHQYLNLIRTILAQGEHRPDRTGTGTLSVFCPPTIRFSLSKVDPTSPSGYSHVLPLLTTKRVFTKAVIAELLWFIKGSTNSKELSNQGVHIWDGNGSREFLDKLGPPQSLREEGDLGPVYGFQWRYFGAEYKDCHTNYEGQGVDQLREVIQKLKNKPYDRRIILSAWNVGDLGSMALPPCHLLAQFYVSFPDAPKGEEAFRRWQAEQQNGASHGSASLSPSRGRLSCTLYQRSADTGLGVPFNIASYALLTHMLAYACDLVPETFNMVLGDAHVYMDHIDALKEQIRREPRPFPGLRIKRDDRGHGNVDGWSLQDFEILNYKPHAGVKMKMSV
ncbi:Thymidylate synthase [Lithohypha guttulata]|nr:Thymidylate synthase [Lithohypha guttulata]